MTEQTVDDRGVSVTLKAGPGYEAPWLVVRAGTVGEVDTILNDKGAVETVLNKAAHLAVGFQGVYAIAKGTGSAGDVQVQNTAPAPQEPPTYAPQGGVPGPQCKHGAMVQRSGNKNGRAWTGYFCPTPKGTPDQCSPQFGN